MNGGPTWATWNGLAREADDNHDIANHNYEAAQKWKAHAKLLEQQLDEVWNLYREARGNGSGQRRIKDAVLEEIKKLDPNNSLLEKSVREKIFIEGKEEDLKTIPEKHH